MTPVVIREAQPEDTTRLSAIARRAKASWGYPEAWLDRWRDELAFTAAYLDEHQVWVAETGGVASGVIALERSAGGWTLDRLWVDGAQGARARCPPQCQGRQTAPSPGSSLIFDLSSLIFRHTEPGCIPSSAVSAASRSPASG